MSPAAVSTIVWIDVVHMEKKPPSTYLIRLMNLLATSSNNTI